MDKHLYEYKAQLVEVVDGDTYDFKVDLGFKINFNIRVRLLGLDTAEIFGARKESTEYQHGMEEKRFAKKKLEEASEIYLRTHKDEKGKYGRYLAEVFVDGDSIKDLLTEEFDRLEE